jgi:hypothetical protein
MEVFFTLLFKILPLYLIILLGFVSGRYLNTQKETIASLLIYILAPVIIFHGVYTTQLSLSILIIPVLFYILSIVFCIFAYFAFKNTWKDSTRNILAFTSGTGNTGYFGLPLAVSFYGESAIGIVAMVVMGMVVYESTLGFFITARGHHTVRESILKVIRLPAIYAFFAGLIFNLAGVKLGMIYSDTLILFRGAYSVLGMMIIGMGLSQMKGLYIDWIFLLASFFMKFVCWPMVISLIIIMDRSYFHIIPLGVSQIIFLLSLTPLAANTVSYATLLKTHPEKAATAVFLSTLFALFFIPFMSLFVR